MADITHTPEYLTLQGLYSKKFSLGYLNTDIQTKFAVISLICYLKQVISKKKPDVTHYDIIKSIMKKEIDEDFIIGLSIVCGDFAYQCNKFMTFDIPDKQIPKKVHEILSSYMPF